MQQLRPNLLATTDRKVQKTKSHKKNHKGLQSGRWKDKKNTWNAKPKALQKFWHLLKRNNQQPLKQFKDMIQDTTIEEDIIKNK